MRKSDFVQHWKAIKPNQQIPMRPVPYKHEGSTYDQDGIRITGDQPFIDAVLSRLKDLLAYEKGDTRLQVVYQQSKDRKTQLPLDSHNCYIQVHTRGPEAQAMKAFVASITHGRTIAISGGDVVRGKKR